MEVQTGPDGKLGVTSCIMLLIGAMVGSAIFSLSGLTILTAGPAAVLSWLLAGVIMLFYGMCMGELACRYPRSGGVYYFPRLAFPGKTGQWLAWMSCWSSILTNIVAIAFSGIYVGIYLSVAFPAAKGLQLPLAIASILFCLILNLIRVELAGKINTLIVLALLASIAVYVTSAFCGGTYEPGMLTPFFSQGTNGTLGFLYGIPTALIGYSGVVALAFMASEIRQAQRTIPLSMTVSITVVAGIYTLMILATLGLVSSAYLLDNPQMQFIPMFCACFTKLTEYPWLSAVVSIAAVLALMTTMLVCVTINARAICAAGEDGLLPEWLGRLSSRGVPASAALVTCLIAMIYSCFPERTVQIVNFGAVFNIITMLLTLLALIRAKGAGVQSPFTVAGGRIIPCLVLAVLFCCNAAGLFAQGRDLWYYTLFFIVLGLGIKLISDHTHREKTKK